MNLIAFVVLTFTFTFQINAETLLEGFYCGRDNCYDGK